MRKAGDWLRTCAEDGSEVARSCLTNRSRTREGMREQFRQRERKKDVGEGQAEARVESCLGEEARSLAAVDESKRSSEGKDMASLRRVGR